MFSKKTLKGLKVTVAAAVFAAGINIFAPNAEAGICIAPRLDGNEIVHIQEHANKHNNTLFYLAYPDGSAVRNTKTGEIYVSFGEGKLNCGLPKDELEKELKRQGIDTTLEIKKVAPNK